MHINRFLCRLLVTAALLTTIGATVAADSASEQLVLLDKQLLSGRVVLQVSHYAPPTGQPLRYGAPHVFPATLLFERPDRFKLVLRAGQKNERRIVGKAGKVRWLDKASGASGSASAEKVLDPITLLLLGTAGELPRYATFKELALGKQPMTATTLRPRAYGTSVRTAVAWFSGGRIVAFEFALDDGSRVFAAVSRFKPNVVTQPGDFELK